MTGKIVGIGPFIGGLNIHDDPTAVDDKELVEALNVELDFDGSLKSRPPIVDSGVRMPLGATGNINLLGYYFAAGNVPYLIGSDGLSKTYYFDGAWHLITSTFSATAMAQFNGQAWLLSGNGVANPGGSWTPAGGFVADANMPRGTVLVAHKFRLWVAPGLLAPANSTRLYYSNVLGQPTFWPVAPSFIDIGAGDGQDIVQVVIYYNNLLIFRSTSIYSFQFSSDITAGIISQVVPGVGLDNASAIAISESSIYFTFEYRAYVFINNRVMTINDKAPFAALTQTGMYRDTTVSIFNQRVIFSYYDTMYVYSIRTQTWTRWRSTANGPIGKIISLEGPSTFPTAICHSSANVPNVPVTTNGVLNPSPQTNLTGWNPLGGTVATAAGQGVRGNNAARLTTDGSATTGIAIGASSGGITVVAGTTITPGVSIKFVAGRTFKLTLQFVNSAGVQVGPTYADPNFLTLPDGSYHNLVGQSYVVPATATRLRLTATALPGTVGTANNIYFDEATTQGTGMVADYFDGSKASTGTDTYAWTGTAFASTSTHTVTVRSATTLTITDGLTTAAENFQCVVQTKNFNYDQSSKYKRLFWWGADVVFRGQLVAVANPIVFSGSVTWGQLLTRTWGQLLAFTWGQPASPLLSVSTTTNTAGTGSTRKFIKLNKGLRFRQINYQLTFSTDGSVSSAPVRLFSLTTFVALKETASQMVT
jgi:hypothetical protein